MRIPDGASGLLEWAYPGRQEEPCLRRVGADRMLCGRFLNPGPLFGYVPAIQPVDPHPVCANCVIALWELFGWCPVCGALTELVGGAVGGHGIAVRTRDGVEVLPEPCSGKGMAPEGER